MLVLLIVCLMKLIEMYTNNNKMARNKCARNAAKENNFGLQNVNKKFSMLDDSLMKQQEGADPYAMNYFYDVDQSYDHLKEFLHHKSGNDFAAINRLTNIVASEFHRCDLDVNFFSPIESVWSFYFYRSRRLFI